jgi:hypothetical protein
MGEHLRTQYDKAKPKYEYDPVEDDWGEVLEPKDYAIAAGLVVGAVVACGILLFMAVRIIRFLL